MTPTRLGAAWDLRAADQFPEQLPLPSVPLPRRPSSAACARASRAWPARVHAYQRSVGVSPSNLQRVEGGGSDLAQSAAGLIRCSPFDGSSCHNSFASLAIS